MNTKDLNENNGGHELLHILWSSVLLMSFLHQSVVFSLAANHKE